MKKFVFVLVIIVIAAGAAAQDPGRLSKKEQRKLIREENARIEKEEMARFALLVDNMVKSATFVLEADMLFDRYGQSTPVQSNINFLMVDSVYGVIQVGSPYYLGRNGVGGVTLEGPVTRYEQSKNEKRSTYSVQYDLRSSFGSYNVSISIAPSGRAEARVSGNFSGSLRYSGRLVHPSASRVYKGSSY